MIQGTLCSSRFLLTANILEMGALLRWLDEGKAWEYPFLQGLYARLVEMKRQIEKQAGVKKSLLPDGQIKQVDIDGNTIIRPPMHWELKELRELRKVKK
ncbi:hypothetical protein ES703_46320 [subsurface metagenome]